MRRYALAMSCVLAVGCTLDLGALRPDAEMPELMLDAAAPEDAEPPTEDTIPAVDSGVPAPADSAPPPADSAPPPADSAPPPADSAPPPPPDTGPLPTPSCGVIGTPCCADSRCDLGVCLRGSCAAYGGAYGTLAGCSPGCQTRNFYTAGCSCPRGFTANPVMSMQASCEGAVTSATLSICTADDRTSLTDWGGAWLDVSGETCLLPNRFTGECSCPAGTASIEMDVDVPGVGGSKPAVFAVCVLSRGESTTFEGAYQLGAAGAFGCTRANPRTGACSCPEGATEQRVPLINAIGADFAAAPIFLCSR